MKMNRKTPICLIILLITNFLYSQNFEKLDSLIMEVLKDYGIKGIGVSYVNHENNITSKGFGSANLNSNFTDSTSIYIASNTKAFTGLAIAHSVREGKMKYEDLISRYIPASYFPKEIDISTISVKDLLAHTHGLSNDALTFRTAYSGAYPYDLRDLLKFTVYRNDDHSKEFRYSNLGYVLSGIILEEVTGKSWKEYFTKVLFKILDLNNTTTYLDFNKDLEAFPFNHHSDQILNSKKSENTLHAAGGIYTTLPDMAKWLFYLTHPDEHKQKLPENYFYSQVELSQGIMGPFISTGYGNGWINGKLYERPVNFHFGSFKGYESMISYAPKSGDGIFVFVNERSGGVRVACMISLYYYLLISDDSDIEMKIKEFKETVDPLYLPEESLEVLFKINNQHDLLGIYESEEYGQLLIDKTGEGLVFQLGKLSALAQKGEAENEIIVEWTPGIKEHFFMVINDKGQVDLKYSDFGFFKKK